LRIGGTLRGPRGIESLGGRRSKEGVGGRHECGSVRR
jgi:hypothetical protein